MSETEADDLAYVRAMAEAGRKAPLLSGRIYVFWGSLIPVAYLAHWAVLSGRFGLPAVSMAFIWGGFGICAAIGMPLLIRSLGNKPGRGSMGNRIDNLVWTMVGASIFSFVLGTLLATMVMDQPPWIWDFVVALSFAGYGVALYTTGVVSGSTWLRLPSFAAVASTAVVPTLAGKPELYLFAAAMVMAVVLVPGIRLMLNEPKDLAEEA